MKRTTLATLMMFVWTFGAGMVAADEHPQDDIIILAIGDSLTAGFGLASGEGFTDVLEVWLQDKLGSNVAVKVINAGVSGDTSKAGAARITWTLAGSPAPDLVLVEFGGNDGLRAIAPNYTRDNIDTIVKILTDQNLQVLLAGMQAPPNLGPEYSAAFNSIFSDVAKAYDVTLYPFFLEGVAADPALNQDDSIHPNQAGVAIIVGQIGPVILEMLTP